MLVVICLRECERMKAEEQPMENLRELAAFILEARLRL